MIYLDHAATCPLDPRVFDAMAPHMKDNWGNASSAHSKGRDAHVAMDESRQIIADAIGLKSHEIIFVSSGSEGNSLALFGVTGKWMETHAQPGHIITLETEHSCSLRAVDRLEEQGWSVTRLPVDENGLMHLDDLRNAFTEDTALVSIQWANSEVGTIQPIEDIAQLCVEHSVPFHCDAVQPVGQLPFPVILPDMMTIAAHKFYGPKGIAVLSVKKGIELQAQILGGGQEFDLRAGTENVPGMVGMATALHIAIDEHKDYAARLTKLRDVFIDELRAIPGISLNGTKENRLPNNVNIFIEDHDAETVVIKLDMADICASSGSACATGSTEPSHVLQAMGKTKQEAKQNVRFSLGRNTTEEELHTVVSTLKSILE